MFRTRFAAAVLAAALLVTAPPAQAQAVGVNATIRNKVMMKTKADRVPRAAVLRERVSLGDAITTAPASVLQVLLLDRTSFTVGANARVTIDRFVYDPSRSASAVGATVAKGAFRLLSGRSTRGMPGQSRVTTPVASIGIRGTMFEGVVGEDAVRLALGEQALQGFSGDPQTATLVLLRGPGKGIPGVVPGAIDVTANGKTVALDEPGLALFVPGPGQDPVGPFLLSAKGFEGLDELLRTAPDPSDKTTTIDLVTNPLTDQNLEQPDGRGCGQDCG